MIKYFHAYIIDIALYIIDWSSTYALPLAQRLWRFSPVCSPGPICSAKRLSLGFHGSSAKEVAPCEGAAGCDDTDLDQPMVKIMVIPHPEMLHYGCF